VNCIAKTAPDSTQGEVIGKYHVEGRFYFNLEADLITSTIYSS